MACAEVGDSVLKEKSGPGRERVGARLLSKRIRWAGAVLVGSFALGCSQLGGSDDSVAPPRGAVDESPAAPGGGAPRAPRGTVTLVGANTRIALGTWPFSGPSSEAASGEDTVSCSLDARGARYLLSVAASRSSGKAPAASFAVELDDLTEAEAELPYLSAEQSRVEVDVALESEGTSYFYYFGRDGVSSPPASSTCLLSLTQLSEQWASGQLSCRGLLASPLSPDAASNGAPGRASATVTFDCPVALKSTPGPGGTGGTSGGSGGSSPAGGGGNVSGSGGSGGATAGSDPGGGTGGSIATPESCHGLAPTCSSRSYATCSSVRGCSVSGECTGVSRGCYSIYSSYSCTSQQGCYWSSLNQNCSGSSRSCRSFSGSLSCVSQEGCDWEDTCEGVSTSCLLLGEYDCELQPGCSWY